MNNSSNEIFGLFNVKTFKTLGVDLMTVFLKKINAEKLFETFKPWLIIFCCGLFYCYQFLLRVLPNTFSQEFFQGYDISASQFGVIIAAYSSGYVICQLPFGVMFDRISIRYFFPIAPIICAIGTLSLSYCNSLISASFSRFLMGVGSAFGFIGAIKVATLILPQKKVSLAIGTIVLFGTLGAGIGGAPVKYLASFFGWREVMRLIGFLGVFLSVAMFYVLSSEIVKSKQIEFSSKKRNILRDIKSIIDNRQIITLSLCGMLMYMPITILGVGWGINFIITFFNTTYKTAANGVFFMFLGAGLGGPIIAFISEMAGNKKNIMFTSSLLSFLLYIFILYGTSNQTPYFIYVSFFAIGVLYSAKTLSFAMACEIMPKNISALTASLLNMVVMSTGIIFHPLVGYLLGYGYSENPVSYSSFDYKIALSILPLSSLIACYLIYFNLEPKKSSRLFWRKLLASVNLAIKFCKKVALGLQQLCKFMKRALESNDV
ncbi:MAG TPA: MFS transporter [Gammaproteobacteria bacterium]|nr:MFS transporter [Gammaproteobacteria bacterium]